MRVQCDNCENNFAAIMCCADEAALCTQCDLRVHAANKLANKHQRVPLFPSPDDPPTCDICQEKRAFFFCLEDRALLCRDCDVSIHVATTLSATHQRYLLTGTRVALEALPNNVKPDNSVDEMQAVPAEASLPLSHISGGHGGQASGHFGGHFDAQGSENRIEGKVEGRMEGRGGFMPQQYSDYGRASTSGVEGRGPSMHSSGLTQGRASGVGGSGMGRKSSYSDMLSDTVPGWRVDELLNIPELADGYTLADIGSSKAEAEATALGDFDWTADLSLFDEQVYAESLHEVPELFPQGGFLGDPGPSRLPNPTKSRARHDMAAVVPDFDDSFVVPDLGMDNALGGNKRRRNEYL